MKRILTSIIILTTGLLFTVPSLAGTTSCEVKGFVLKPHGGVSCADAKKIYRIYTSNRHLPKGWGCAASAKECFNDDGKKGFEFRLK